MYWRYVKVLAACSINCTESSGCSEPARNRSNARGIAVHVRTLFEVDVPGQRLDVHHGGLGGLVEVQDDERTGGPGVCTCTVRYDLGGGLTW
jgi:hypothetical protein